MKTVYGTHDEKTLEQFEFVSKSTVHSALMADGHLGYVMPIGGVAAYRNKVSPIGVGVDIACGNCAIRTDLTADDISGDLDALADEIISTIALGVGGVNDDPHAPKDDALFESSSWAVVPRKHRASLMDRSRHQLGTTGGGNHYIDVFQNEDGWVWVGVHFGSRALGFRLAHSFVALAQGLGWTDRPNMNEEVLLDLDTQLGQDYWAGMELAGDYAYAGREWVTRRVVEILGGTEVDMVHNHHNYAWRENHVGDDLIVVRKGATPAFPGQRGFVGGSMGDKSVILQGYPNKDVASAHTLLSTVHGAGRVMGRMQAKGKWKKGRCVRPGRVSHEMMDAATTAIVLRGGDLDEAPQVYRKLDDVLDVQPGIEVLHTLTPLIVCMAPSRTR
jgi:tRNA-splicing ligase RtcB